MIVCSITSSNAYLLTYNVRKRNKRQANYRFYDNRRNAFASVGKRSQGF